ncbi:hypothetical protein T492DRAFT_896469 [Pavlovales sp. CCMP2436]|nr:hypothetical protein T492DRAFT_896469 [Pavlovales sp. CCMP2436]
MAGKKKKLTSRSAKAGLQFPMGCASSVAAVEPTDAPLATAKPAVGSVRLSRGHSAGHLFGEKSLASEVYQSWL